MLTRLRICVDDLCKMSCNRRMIRRGCGSAWSDRWTVGVMNGCVGMMREGRCLASWFYSFTAAQCAQPRETQANITTELATVVDSLCRPRTTTIAIICIGSCWGQQLIAHKYRFWGQRSFNCRIGDRSGQRALWEGVRDRRLFADEQYRNI
jgi:hypothetical protein